MRKAACMHFLFTHIQPLVWLLLRQLLQLCAQLLGQTVCWMRIAATCLTSMQCTSFACRLP